MHIVQVVWYKIYPAITGGQKGIAGFTDSLSKQVTVSTLCSKDNAVDAKATHTILPILNTGKLQVLWPSNYIRILQYTKAVQATHLVLEHPYYMLLYYILPNKIKKILHSHNIEYLRAKHTHKWWWPVLYYIEKWATQKADMIWCKTKADQSFVVHNWHIPIAKTCIVPYGITKVTVHNELNENDDTLRKSLCIPNNHSIILLAASYNYAPNAEALLHLLNQVWPVIYKHNKHITLLLIGTHLPECLSAYNVSLPAHVHAVGQVANLAPYYAISTLLANTVLTAQGVQTKSIDALAQHCKVVMYHTAAHGMPVHEPNCVIVPVVNAEQYAAVVLAQLLLPKQNTSDEYISKHMWYGIVQSTLHYVRTYDEQ